MRDRDDDVPDSSEEDSAENDEDTEDVYTTRLELESATTRKTSEFIAKLSMEIASRLKDVPLAEIEAGLWGEASIDEFINEVFSSSLTRLRGRQP